MFISVTFGFSHRQLGGRRDSRRTQSDAEQRRVWTKHTNCRGENEQLPMRSQVLRWYRPDEDGSHSRECIPQSAADGVGACYGAVVLLHHLLVSSP